MSIDAPANNAKCPDDRVTSTLMWVTDEAPSDIFAEGDAGNCKLGTAPPAGGAHFAVLDFLPGNALHGQHRQCRVDASVSFCATIIIGHGAVRYRSERNAVAGQRLDGD